MRNYIILNGNNSNEITGLLIQSLPPISKPLMRTAIEEIDGRDGDIVTNLGYSAYDKEVSIGLYGSYDVDEVIKYFSDNSKGQVTFSNEPDKYYNYEIINQIDFERLIRFKTAIVTLHCQPFKYPVNETPVEIAYQYVTNEDEEMDLDNTADAPMEIDLLGNTSQASDPTPSAPVPVSVVSGDNTIKVEGKNLFDKDNVSWYRNNNGSFDNTTDNSTTRIRTSSFKLNSGKTYTISGIPNGISLMGVRTYNEYGGEQTFGATITDNSFVLDNGVKYIHLLFSGTNFDSSTNALMKNANIQIEKGNTTTTYEPYTGQSHLISLGVENLFDKNNANTIAGYIDTGNVIRAYATNYLIYLKVQSNTTYTLKKNVFTSGGITIGYTQATPTIGGSVTNKTAFANTNIATFTTPNDITYLVAFIYNDADNSSGKTLQQVLDGIQLEKGSKANSYSPYGTTPIELCKIGTYQDKIYKDNGKWYLHKEIGKVVLDGDTNKVTLYGNYGDDNKPLFYMNKSDMVIPSAYTETILMSDNYTQYIGSAPQPMANNQIRGAASTGIIYLRDDRFTTASDFNTQLQNSNVLINYVLATPTNTEITDTTLLEQLENIANARSYDTSTHITQNANDKPFILNATALQKGSDTGVVDNDGNIYSKPTLDIEGTGTVGIYLNNNQMFSIDMSSSSECVIDVTNLEAYDPTTDVLMNRQVTGDYSNFTLPVGESQVKVSGNVTKATISNYVRWL